jgi:hypothetical protein
MDQELEMTTVNEIIAAIAARAEGRYEVSCTEDELLSLFTDAGNAGVCRLRRLNADAGWRTILISSLAFESASIQAVRRWAADVRDVLPEPQTADLYMFLVIEGIPGEEASRIETDDRFCRKVVLRASESVNDFLDRTFLATLSPVGESGAIGDPLLAALFAMAGKHPWTEPQLSVWRELLVSGKSGSEVAQYLDAVASGREVFP